MKFGITFLYFPGTSPGPNTLKNLAFTIGKSFCGITTLSYTYLTLNSFYATLVPANVTAPVLASSTVIVTPSAPTTSGLTFSVLTTGAQANVALP